MTFLAKMVPRRFSIILTFFVAGFCRAHSVVPLVEGTLPEDFLPDLKMILSSALRQSPQTLSNEIYVAQAEYTRTSTAAQRLPSVSSSASFALSRITTEIPTPAGGFRPGQPTTNEDTAYGPYYGVSLSQNLFTWYQVTNQIKIADIGVRIAEKNYAGAYAALAETIRGQYLGLIFQKVGLRNQRFSLNQTARLLSLDEERLRTGSLAPAELIQPRAGYATARLAMARSEALYASSLRRLARLAGLGTINEAAIPLEVPKWSAAPEAPASLAALFKRDGVEITFQGQVNALRLKEADLNYKNTSTRLLPRFAISANVAKYNSQTVTATTITQQAAVSTSASIGGSWTIFDGFATRAAKRGVLAGKRLIEQQQKNLAAQIADQLETLVQFIDFAAKTLEMTETIRVSYVVNVDRVRDDFKRGSVTEDAVTTSLMQLYMQDAAVVSARMELMNRWCELVSLVGVDPVLNQLPARYAH